MVFRFASLQVSETLNLQVCEAKSKSRTDPACPDGYREQKAESARLQGCISAE